MKSIIAIIVGFFLIGSMNNGGSSYIIGGIIGYLALQLYELKVRIHNLEIQLKDKSIHRTSQENIEKDVDLQPTIIEENNFSKVDPAVEKLSELHKREEVLADLVEVELKVKKLIPETTNEHPNLNIEIPNPSNEKIETKENQVVYNDESIEILEEEKPDPVNTGPTPLEIAFSRVKTLVVGYFTGGNSLVRTGMLVLFIGVAFLLKYVAERTVVPVEFRYIAVSLGSLAMLVLGWKLRIKRPGFALSLQGGGIGLLYLTLFAALRLHDLIPPHIVLFLLIAIVLLSATLAILQDSMALAVIGMLGGFAAPILTSSGSGSHVQLFSYYLLLNIGVFAISWFKSWRILNVIGFVATFGIGSIWGFKFYKPEFLMTVEPFLIAYFLLYTFIAVLFAIKQPPKLKGINDGTVIFGAPLVGFALQSALMKGSEYGLAYSALVLGVFYVVFAYIINLMKKPYMKDLIESFVALGIGFATLAIPLGFDGRVTSAMWAVEGCALLWVGIRQSRIFPRVSGYALTMLGMGAFFLEQKASAGLTPWLNADYIGTLLIFLSTAFIALYTRKHKGKILSLEHNWIPSIMMISSLLWWVFGGLSEIHSHYLSSRFIIAELLLAVTAIALLFSADRVKFKLVKKLSIGTALVMLAIIPLYLPHIDLGNKMFMNVSFIGLLVLALSHLYFSIYWSFEKRHRLRARFNSVGVLFLATGLCSWLYVWVREINAYYPLDKFIMLELFLAFTAFMVLFTGIKFKLINYKLASVVVTLLMLLPAIVIPKVSNSFSMVFNIPFIGLSIYTVTHLVMSWYWQRDKSLSKDSRPVQISNIMWLIGILAWTFTGHNEINNFSSGMSMVNISLVFMSFSFVFWLVLANKLNWKSMHNLSYVFLPYLLSIGYYILVHKYKFHESYGMFAWLFAAIVNYWILKIYDNDKALFKNWYHLTSLLFFVFIVMVEFNELIKNIFGNSTIWHHVSNTFIVLLLSIGLFKLSKSKVWPFRTYQATYFHQGLMVLFSLTWFMLVTTNLMPPGKATVISYLPIINPIDLTGIVFLVFAWKVFSSQILQLTKEANKIAMIALPITAFILLNASMLRTFHYWHGIDYKFNTMASSFMVQSAFSILWSLTAVVLMVLASKKQWRIVWLTGLGLMVAVVIKLFIIDMSASGTIARIVAFLSVGMLLSLVGYFSPLPPSISDDAISSDDFQEQFTQEEE